MIIGLAGLKGSGKDTVGAYLVKEHGFERKSFADPLKRSVAALFDIPFSEVDKLKNDSGARVELDGGPNRVEGEGVVSIVYADMTFRTLLQRYGTEAHRGIFGEDFWVDQTLPVQGYYPGRKIVVTDVRFANEAQRVNHLGGALVQVWHPTAETALDQHASEVIDFECDYQLENAGTIDELFAKTETLLERIGNEHFRY